MSVKIFDKIIGKTLVDIRHNEKQSIVFVFKDFVVWEMKHDQECCEHVELEDVTGNEQDLIGYPLLMAEKVSNEGEGSEDTSVTWTYFKFATVKGHVEYRWYGESNGWYSEDVDFGEIKKADA